MATVLVVADDEVLFRLLPKLLYSLGHKSIVAKNVDDALRMAAVEPLDAVLCNFVVLGISGTELVKKLRTVKPQLPVVLMSGYATPEVEIAVKAEGAFGLLGIPFTRKSLEAALIPALQSQQHSDKHVTVLVADDDKYVRRLLEKALRKGGYHVVTCADGDCAITTMSQVPIDVLITDIEMPEVDGLQLLSWTRQHHPKVQPIVISGGRCTPIFAKCFQLGAASCLRKPVRLKQLLASVSSAAASLSSPDEPAKPS